MTDEIKADAEKVVTDAKVDLSATKGWVKSHVVWLVGFATFIVGIYLGHYIK